MKPSDRISPQDEAARSPEEVLRAIAARARIGGGTGCEAVAYITADQCEWFAGELDVLRGELQATQHGRADSDALADMYRTQVIRRDLTLRICDSTIGELRTALRELCEATEAESRGHSGHLWAALKRARGVIGEEPNERTT